jgi:hypothetical protein
LFNNRLDDTQVAAKFNLDAVGQSNGRRGLTWRSYFDGPKSGRA